MPASVSLVPGTSILEYRFSNDVDHEQYIECLDKASRILREIPQGPIYVLLDLRTLRSIPHSALQATRRHRRSGHRTHGIAIVGGNAFHRMLVNMVVYVFLGREIDIAYCQCRDEALAALRQMADCELAQHGRFSTSARSAMSTSATP